jgi:threonine/homoserine/homoserine lactone efflux protein
VLETTEFALFLATALVLIFVPGPDMIYVATRGIGQGRRVAAISTAGVCLGYVAHTALAALGLSALLASSATAFRVVQYVGAAYLLYLGVRTILDRGAFVPPAESPPSPSGALLSQGVLTSLLNPKGILFFLSFLPQFVVPSAGGIALQVVLLGLTFTLLCLLVYGAPEGGSLCTRVKDLAYAWRQMVFFLARQQSPAQREFVEWANDRLASRTPQVLAKIRPAVDGLNHVVAGGTFDAAGLGGIGRRLLGWSIDRHWMLALADPSVRRTTQG